MRYAALFENRPPNKHSGQLPTSTRPSRLACAKRPAQQSSRVHDDRRDNPWSSKLRPGNHIEIRGMRAPFDGFYYVTKQSTRLARTDFELASRPTDLDAQTTGLKHTLNHTLRPLTKPLTKTLNRSRSNSGAIMPNPLEELLAPQTSQARGRAVSGLVTAKVCRSKTMASYACSTCNGEMMSLRLSARDDADAGNGYGVHFLPEVGDEWLRPRDGRYELSYCARSRLESSEPATTTSQYFTRQTTFARSLLAAAMN